MKTLKQISTILLCVFGSSAAYSAFGWDNPGHMAVAGLAFDELASTQQARLAALLRNHPGLSLISAGFPNGDPTDRELVMAAATWPDLAKRSGDYKDNGYEANDPPVTTVKFDHLMHKGWHFIDTPLWVGDGPAPTLPAVPQVNAVGVVNVLRTQLGANESDDAKAYDVAWLLHLVGDLHQPLHAVTGVSSALPKGDTGGNSVRLAGVTRGETELHAFWDDILGKTAPADKHTFHLRLDKDVATANEIIVAVQSLPLCADADNCDPAAWASESFKMAQQDVYALDFQTISTDRGDQLRVTLDDSYSQTATRDAKIRIRAAGHRLALLLKQILGP